MNDFLVRIFQGIIRAIFGFIFLVLFVYFLCTFIGLIYSSDYGVTESIRNGDISLMFVLGMLTITSVGGFMAANAWTIAYEQHDQKAIDRSLMRATPVHIQSVDPRTCSLPVHILPVAKIKESR